MIDTRDWFPTADEPDPIHAAQAGMKPTLPKRFYKETGVDERDGAFVLTLDGRTAKTPGRQLIAVPSAPLADALAAEWAGQGNEINPSTMPITRIVNSAIDGVAQRQVEVARDLARYAETDLVFYRAGAPARLVQAQDDAWRPLLDWAEDTFGARFLLAEGVMHVAQPAEALDTIRAAVESQTSPFALAALHVMTTVTGSLLIALAHAAGRIDASEAWEAAHVDERYQESVWGEDHEAMVRRKNREDDFMAASRVYRLVQGHGELPDQPGGRRRV